MEERQVRTKPKGSNTCVSPRPPFEIKVGLIDVGPGVKPPKYRYGLVGTDNFTKKAWAYPNTDNTPEHLTEGRKDLINKHWVPGQFYNDQEGAFQSLEWVGFINRLNIKHITSMTRAHTARRVNRTLKNQVRYDIGFSENPPRALALPTILSTAQIQ